MALLMSWRMSSCSVDEGLQGRTGLQADEYVETNKNVEVNEEVVEVLDAAIDVLALSRLRSPRPYWSSSR